MEINRTAANNLFLNKVKQGQGKDPRESGASAKKIALNERVKHDFESYKKPETSFGSYSITKVSLRA